MASRKEAEKSKLDPTAKMLKLERKIEELVSERENIEKRVSQLEEYLLRQKNEDFKSLIEEVILILKEKRRKSQLEEMRLRQEKEILVGMKEEKLSIEKQKMRLTSHLESQLEEMRLRREKGKLESQLEEMILRQEKGKVESPEEETRLRQTIEELTSTLKEIECRRMNTLRIIVSGGRDQNGQSLNSLEGFIFPEGRWIELPPMNTPRSFAAAVVVDNKIIVSGGDTGDTPTDTIEILNLAETPLQWITSAATLPVPLSAHKTVAYKERLITIGGHDGNAARNSDKIYEVLLTPPYTTRVLGSLPQPRAWHGAELVNDRIFIFGGGRNPALPNDDVLVYNLSNHQCNVMPQLPYRVQGMATVCWENKVLLLGGVDETEQEVNHVITYDIESGETANLSPMTQRRGGCCAVIIPADNTIATAQLVALGSLQQLNTVEGYNFHSRAWRNLPHTREVRELCTAVVPPINITFEQ